MRSKNFSYKGQESMIIYMTESERNNPEIMQKVDTYKHEYKNVTVFVSGSKKIEDALKDIVNYHNKNIS